MKKYMPFTPRLIPMPPIQGNRGVISVSNPGTTTPTLNWNTAEDDYTRVSMIYNI